MTPLVDQLESRFPVEVRTVRRRSSRHRAFRPLTKRRLLVGEAIFLLRYLASPCLYGTGWRFVCRDGHYATLFFNRLLYAFGRRRRVYLFNFYLHDLGRNPIVQGTLRVLLTREVHVLAQTRSEEHYFRQFLPAENVALIPYSQGESSFVELAATSLGEHVFAGGMANRDYDALLRCAAALPEIPFVVVASNVNQINQPVPANVTLRRDVPTDEFDRLVADSRMVVIPLKEDVGSSGQMVLLKAMSLGKTTLIPRVGAVLDYIDSDQTGVFYELGDDDSLETAISALYGDRPRLVAVGKAARESYAANFTLTEYQRQVVDYICADG